MSDTTIRLQIEVTDDLYRQLEREAGTRIPVALVAARRLQQAASLLPSSGKVIVVTPADVETLEGILGSGSLLNSQDLRQKVERLAGISFQHVRLPLNPNQLEELQRRADRLSLTPKELAERIAAKLYEMFFTTAGG